MKNGKKYSEQLERADAHPYGARPFVRKNYVNKFITLTKKIISVKESKRFLNAAKNLKKLKSGQLRNLNITVSESKLRKNKKEGIF